MAKGRDSMMVSGSTILRIAGASSIVAACISFLTGLVGFDSYLNPPLDFPGFPPYHDPEFLVLGFLGMLGFALGVGAGIFTLKRSHHAAVVIGLLIMILAPIIPFDIARLEALQSSPSCIPPLCNTNATIITDFDLRIFGTPTIILSTLVLLFTTLKRNEFVNLRLILNQAS